MEVTIGLLVALTGFTTNKNKCLNFAFNKLRDALKVPLIS